MRTSSSQPAEGDRPPAVEAVLVALGSAVGSLRCAGSQRLVRLGISMTHFHVLTLLRHHDAMPMGRLAEVLDASMSSATGIIDRMEERGLVERVRVPDDRRIVLVQVTQAGRDLVDEAELVKSEVMANALTRLAPAQLERLSAAAADLETAVNAELESAPDRYAGITECMFGHGHPSHGHPAHSHAHPIATTSPSTAPATAASPLPSASGA